MTSPFETALLDLDQRSAWEHAIRECGSHDTYHSAAYHELSRERDDDRPVLFVFRSAEGTAALPFIIRSISDVPGVDGEGLRDGTSAYGYPGLLASIDQSHSSAETFRRRFQSAFSRMLRDQGLVCLFVRQNPLIQTSWVLGGMGDIRETGWTVTIDLSLSDEEQSLQTNENHRRNLRKALKHGVRVEQDDTLEHLQEFKNLYRETMQRVGAEEHYFFSPRYFDSMAAKLGSSVRLFHARLNGQIISSVMVFVTDRIIQYHLGCTHSDFLKLSPIRVVFDHIRRWGKQSGYLWFHLGGGVGGRKDSLYRFKSGFSRLLLVFETVGIVVNEKAYDALCGMRQRWLDENELSYQTNHFFPQYRRMTD